MTAGKSNARRQPGAAANQGSRALHANSAAAQRARLLLALHCGPLTTLQARSGLDVMHPGGRIMELRRQGHQIATVRVLEPTDCGQLHSVARYVLVQEVRP